MGRPESPDGRRVPVSFKLSEAEAALVDSARGDLERGPWMRQAALGAAKRNTGIPEPLRVPLAVSNRQPPGTVTAVSAGKGPDGRTVVHGAAMVNVAADAPAPRPRKCRHPKVRVKGVCPDCTEYVASKP